MSKLNTGPLSGTRDFLPLDVLRRKFVVEIIERVFQSYGFEPLETPTMERLETLLGKYGEEGDQLIFRVMKRGEKLQRTLEETPTENNLADAGLRYDLTVPLARVAAEYATQLPRFLKRYQIQPVFRADRPAKGRYREFFQCDLDIVGSTSPLVETEVLNASAEILHLLGFRQPEDFTLRLNHRAVLKGLMETAGIPPNLEESALVAVDKLDKIGLDGVVGELESRRIPAPAVDNLFGLMQEIPSGNAAVLEWLERTLQEGSRGREGVSILRQLHEYCSTGPASRHLRIDPFLARGLSYYTGPIFEIEFAGFSGSVGGGGRYDNLIGMFSGQQVPACGLSLGLERLLMILADRNLFPPRLAGQPQLLVTQHDASTVQTALVLAQRLRDHGFRVDLYPDQDRYGKQFKYAEQRGIRFVLLTSPHEIEKGVVAVKDLKTGEQHEIPESELHDWLSVQLTKSDDRA